MKVSIDTSQAVRYAGKLARAVTKVRPDKATKHSGNMLLARTRAYASGRPGPNVITGQYRASITVKHDFDRASATATATVGSDAPQAARLEFGFKGADSLGRIYCVDMETEALTERGWVGADDLSVGDRVMSMDPDTGMMEWASVDAVNVFDGPHDLISIEGRTMSALATGDHRWLIERYYARRSEWIREWRTTDELKSNCRVPLTQKRGDAPDVPTVDDDIVELAAWFWTEGSFMWSRQATDGGQRQPTTRPIGLSVSQSPTVNPAYARRIEDLLTRIFGSPGRFADGAHWNTTHNRHTGVNVYKMDRVSCWLLEDIAERPSKALRPEWLATLTLGQLETLIDVSMMADGHTDPSGCRRLSQASEARIRSFEVACALAGQPTVTRHRQPRADGTGERWETTLLRTAHTHAVGSALRRDRPTGSMRRVWHDGPVWCPTTSTGTWLARRDGKVYVTGNSQPAFPHYRPALDEMERRFPAIATDLAMQWVPEP